jgi:hypothetical protein
MRKLRFLIRRSNCQPQQEAKLVHTSPLLVIVTNYDLTLILVSGAELNTGHCHRPREDRP